MFGLAYMFGMGIFEMIIIGVVGLLLVGGITILVTSLGGRDR